MPTQGERIAGFILITGIDGIRYALRQHAVSVVSDLDPAQDETLIQLHGGTVVRVPSSLDEPAISRFARPVIPLVWSTCCCEWRSCS